MEEKKPTENTKLAMQTRCVHCKREQYGPAVFGVSQGEQGCSWCGELSGAMTEDEYREALKGE